MLFPNDPSLKDLRIYYVCAPRFSELVTNRPFVFWVFKFPVSRYYVQVVSLSYNRSV